MQERLESSVIGRMLISIFIFVVLVGVVVWNVPSSDLGRRAQYRIGGIVNALGLDQTWAVFAPDPPRQELNFEARIVYDDGTERTWRPPRGDPVLSPYRDYRWLKWAEWMSNGSDVSLFAPAAAWIARQEENAGRHPVTVSLVRQSYDLPIGAGRSSPRPLEFYSYPVAGGSARPPR